MAFFQVAHISDILWQISRLCRLKNPSKFWRTISWKTRFSVSDHFLTVLARPDRKWSKMVKNDRFSDTAHISVGSFFGPYRYMRCSRFGPKFPSWTWKNVFENLRNEIFCVKTWIFMILRVTSVPQWTQDLRCCYWLSRPCFMLCTLCAHLLHIGKSRFHVFHVIFM